MKNPDFLQENENWSKIQGMSIDSLESVKKNLPKLNVNEAPYFIFLDTKGIVYETSSEQEAVAFLNK